MLRTGVCILRETTQIDEGSICVTAHHHERLDGSGYPEGLRGDQISLFGQDSYHKRPASIPFFSGRWGIAKQEQKEWAEWERE